MVAAVSGLARRDRTDKGMDMKNGHDKEWGDPKVTSLSAARKKAEAAKRASSAQGGAGEPRSVRQLLVGALLVAMAIGFLLHLSRPLWQGAMALAP